MSLVESRFPRIWIVVWLALAAMACGPEEPDFDQVLAEGTSLYAREKEEPIERHFFRDRRDGFFVDVGCFQPKEFNTTYYLEKHLN